MRRVRAIVTTLLVLSGVSFGGCTSLRNPDPALPMQCGQVDLRGRIFITELQEFTVFGTNNSGMASASETVAQWLRHLGAQVATRAPYDKELQIKIINERYENSGGYSYRHAYSSSRVIRVYLKMIDTLRGIAVTSGTGARLLTDYGEGIINSHHSMGGAIFSATIRAIVSMCP